MFRRASNTTLIILGAGLSACAESPTQPSLAPAARAAAAAAPRWEAIRLANYPGEATAINSQGQVVGFYSAPNGTRGFVWSNGDLRHVGTLGGTNARPLAINESGQVVGGSSTASGQFHAFLWQKGTMRDLGTLGAERSFATAIEAGGRIAGYTEALDGTTLGFIHENGTMKRLAGLDQGFSIAYDIDNVGRVTGVYGSPDAPRAFRWVAGQVRDLGSLGGGTGTGYALGPNGKVVGETSGADGAQRAYLWQNGRMMDLGDLGGGHAGARSISGLQHVTGWSVSADGVGRSFLWKGGAMSPIGPGQGNGVNRDGWVAGIWNIGGRQFPVLWRRRSEPPPPPNVTIGTSFFVSEQNWSVDPAVDTVAVGQEMTWTWMTGPAVSHSVQSVGKPNFPSSPLTGGVGTTHKVKFTAPGVYLYNCVAHPGNMKGRVVVR